MNEIDTLLKEAGLNSSQRKFCKIAQNKNVRLLAPAGAGKTYSLLWRCKAIAEICRQKELPEPNFLILAFTKSARQELEERIRTQNVFLDIHATIQTLNAYGWGQLKRPKTDLLIEPWDKQKAVIYNLVPLCEKQQFEDIASGFNTPEKRVRNSAVLMSLIDLFKSLGFTHFMTKSDFTKHTRYLKELGLLPILDEGYENLFILEGIKDKKQDIKKKAKDDFFKFWKKAVVELRQHNRYTFEDQKYWARMYFEDLTLSGNAPQDASRFTHIMIDEFQDINPLDLELIKAICNYNSLGKTKTRKSALTIIGDDDQAIFGWRGTSPHFILEPEKYFNAAFETCVLDTNYRSPKKIVEISNRLLEKNKNRVPKTIKSAAKGTAYVKVQSRKRMFATLDSTVALTRDLLENKNCHQVALISRRQVSLFPYQILLSAEGIKYHVASDMNIFDGEAMISLRNILKTVYRARYDDVDEPVEALLGICDKFEKYQLSNAERSKLGRYLYKRADSFSEALKALREYPNLIKKNPASELGDSIEKLLSSKTVYELMNTIESDFRGFDQDYSKKDIDIHYKDPQFYLLKEISRRYDSDFKRFYDDIKKASNAVNRSKNRNDSNDREDYIETCDFPVYLLTATRSKGLEFDAVIIIDADDDEWPNHLTCDIEEERRLFYVALSRARKYLYFVTTPGKLSSRFLLEAGLE